MVAEDETVLLTDETACTDVEVAAALSLDSTAELAASTVATALTSTFSALTTLVLFNADEAVSLSALTWLATEALLVTLAEVALATLVTELSLAVANITCWLLLDVDCALALATTGFSLTLSACAFAVVAVATPNTV
ncbi:hypothetical protein PS425_09905, partial [Limosilactobacillus fermentum]|uniref:hypothetical protein n=2 Tax=Limosilactobacillus fermentum TaxID=1613 RepID=UPI0019D65EEA